MQESSICSLVRIGKTPRPFSVSDAPSRLVGSAAYDSVGTSIVTGDIDDDGLDEILIGTPYADEEELDAGGVSIFFGCD